MASAVWDAAYATDFQSWDPDSVWDVDFAAALEQGDEAQRFQEPPVASSKEEAELLLQKFQQRKSFEPSPKQRSVETPQEETELEKRARRASQTAAKLLEQQQAQAAEEQRQRQAFAEQRRREMEAAQAKLAEQRQASEEALKRLRERMAQARQEAKKAAEEEVQASTQAGATQEYIRQHIARAKEKARELQALIDEESQRKEELEAIRLRHVEAPAAKDTPSSAAVPEFTLQAQRASQAALRTMQEREALKEIEKFKRQRELQHKRQAELQRREQLAQRLSKEEQEIAALQSKIEQMQEELRKATEAEASLKASKSKKNAAALKEATERVQQLTASMGPLEEELLERRVRLQQEQKEEKKRQEDEDILWVKESGEMESGSLAKQAWSSVLHKKKKEPEPVPDENAAATAVAINMSEAEVTALQQQLTAMPAAARRKNIRFLMDPSWGEGSLTRPGRSLVRVRKFKHLIWAPEETEEHRLCVLVIFTDVVALCKPEVSGLLRLLFRPAARSLTWAELATFDPAVIAVHFPLQPPVYLRCSSPVESHYWMYLFPKPAADQELEPGVGSPSGSPTARKP